LHSGVDVTKSGAIADYHMTEVKIAQTHEQALGRNVRGYAVRGAFVLNWKRFLTAKIAAKAMRHSIKANASTISRPNALNPKV
jgi:hypothetical protein